MSGRDLGLRLAVAALGLTLPGALGLLLAREARLERAPAPDLPAAPGDPARAANVLLVTVDGLRADVVGCYGGPRWLTPAIDGLARAGSRFDRALAPSPGGDASLRSLLGLGEAGRTGGTTLASELRAAGYETMAVGVGGVPPEELRLGFASARGPAPDEPAALTRWLRAARDELDQRRPWFLWLHLGGPRLPFEPLEPDLSEVLGRLGSPLEPEAARELANAAARELGGDAGPEARAAVRAAYLSEVRRVDRLVSAALAASGPAARPIVAFASTRGTELWDRGGLGQGTGLGAEQVRVPLVVAGPEDQPAGQVVRRPVSLRRLPATLLELTGSPAAPTEAGRSLVRAGRLGEPGLEPVASTLAAGGDMLWSVARGPFRLVSTGRGRPLELYDEEADPDGSRDLARDRPADLAWMLAQLRGVVPLADVPEVGSP